MKQSTREIISEIEATINHTSPLGIQIGILVARLEFATRLGRSYGEALQRTYEGIGNDRDAEAIKVSLQQFQEITE